MNLAPNSTHYELLGIARGASCEGVKRLRRPLSRRYHPDTGDEPNGALMARINHAIDVLSDPVKRQHYDETLGEELTEVDLQRAKGEAERIRRERAEQVRSEEVGAFEAALRGASPPSASRSVAPPGQSASAPPAPATAPGAPRRSAAAPAGRWFALGRR